MDFLVMSKLLDKLETLIENNIEEYDSNCAYEVEIYNFLSTAGINANPPPPPPAGKGKNFCFGTDAGADASFTATWHEGESRVFNLELKKGDGMKMGASALSSRGQDIVDIVRNKNTVSNIASLLELDILELNRVLEQTGMLPRKSKGLSLTLPDGVSSFSIDTSEVGRIATDIVNSQEADMAALTSAGRGGLGLYYYFGRTATATALASKHGIDVSEKLPTVLSMKDADLAGSLVDNYNKSNTFYIQIKGSGLFYLGSDPLTLADKLGVKNYTGTIKSTGTGAFNASGGGGGTRLLTFGEVPATLTYTDGSVETINVPIQARHRLFNWKQGEKFTSSGATSGFDLSDVASAQALAVAVSTPPIVVENTSRAVQSLIKELFNKNKNTTTTKTDLLKLLLQEGNRGVQYETTLVAGVNNAGVEGVTMERNDVTAWDLNAYVEAGDEKLQGKIEVKLSSEDQLGKIWKESFAQLQFDPSSKEWIGVMKNVGTPFSAGKGKGKTITQADVDLGDHLINVLNGNPRTANEMMKIITNDPENFPDQNEIIDLKRGFSTVLRGKSGRGRGYGITGGVRDSEYRTLKQAQAARQRAGEPEMTEEEEAGFAQIQLLIPAEDVTHIFDSKVNYLIVGNGKGSESSAAGRIGLVGSDVLGTGVAPITFSDSRIEIRWGNKGSKANPNYSFVIETRAADLLITGGTEFSSGEELAKILGKGDEAIDRTSRRSEIGGQDLGLPSAHRRRSQQKAGAELQPESVGQRKSSRLTKFYGKRMSVSLLKNLLNN